MLGFKEHLLKFSNKELEIPMQATTTRALNNCTSPSY